MPGIRTIAVLVHEADENVAERTYLIWAMCRAWEARGIGIEVVRGTSRRARADLLIPLIDLTVIPDEYQAFIESHPRVVNRDLRDISKSRISRNLVRPGDGYEGPVVVKTDRNFGGWPERRLAGERMPRRRSPGGLRGRVERVTGAARRRRRAELAEAEALDPKSYPVFDSPSQVPPQVFENPALVVERFRPERHGKMYCVRSYVFCGSRGYAKARQSPDPIIKGSTAETEVEVSVPEEIIAERERLGMDLGKLDFVMNEGECVLIDVNRTPTFGVGRFTPAHLARAAWVARGIAQWDSDVAESDRSDAEGSAEVKGSSQRTA